MKIAAHFLVIMSRNTIQIQDVEISFTRMERYSCDSN